MPGTRRRRFLAMIGVSAMGGVAGCSGSDPEDSPTETGQLTGALTSTPTPTPVQIDSDLFEWRNPQGPGNRRFVGHEILSGADPDVKWTESFPGAPSAIYADGRIIVGGGNLYTVEPRSGVATEVHSTPGDPRSMWYDDGVVYLLAGGSTLGAYDIDARERLWQRTLPKEAHNLVYVDGHVWTAERETGRLLQFDAEDGEQTGSVSGWSVDAKAWNELATDGEYLYQATFLFGVDESESRSYTGGVIHRDPKSGDVVTKIRRRERAYAPQVTEHELYYTDRIGEDFSLNGYELTTEDFVFGERYPADMGIAAPVIGANTVYTSGETTRAFDRETGERQWESGVTALMMIGTPETLYVVSRRVTDDDQWRAGPLIALNTNSGTERWRIGHRADDQTIPCPTPYGFLLPGDEQLSLLT